LVRSLLALVLLIIAVAAAVAAGAAAVLTRNVLDPAGFSRVVVASMQSPAGLALVHQRVESQIRDRAVGQPEALSSVVATATAAWAVAAIESDAAPRILGPLTVGIQQGLLTGDQTRTVQLDVRALATAVQPPPIVAALLAMAQGDILVDIPWVQVSPLAAVVLQQLDRHRSAPTLLGLVALITGVVALLFARRRGLTLVLLGLFLAVAAYGLRPIATYAHGWIVDARTSDQGLAALSKVAINEIFVGWSAVSGALIAIGLALALVGAVLGFRRPRRT